LYFVVKLYNKKKLLTVKTEPKTIVHFLFYFSEAE